MRLAVARLHERPFHTGGKSSAATAAQTRLRDDVHDLGGRHPQRFLQRLVAAALFPAVERARFGIPKVFGEYRRFSWVGQLRKTHYPSSARSSGTLSGVTDSMNFSLIITGV